MFEITCDECKTTELIDGSDPPTREDLRRACGQHGWMNFIRPDGSYRAFCSGCGIEPLCDKFIKEVPKNTDIDLHVPEPDTSEDWKNK